MILPSFFFFKEHYQFGQVSRVILSSTVTLLFREWLAPSLLWWRRTHGCQVAALAGGCTLSLPIFVALYAQHYIPRYGR